MKKMNFYFNSNKLGLLCMMLVVTLMSRVSAQCPAVNYSFPAANCAGTVTVAMATGVGVSLERAATGGSPTISKADIGQTLRYIGPGGCWNTVTVEDKAAPTVGTVTDITIACSDANASNLYPSALVTGYTGPVAASGTGIPIPAFADCSTIASVSYYDEIQTQSLTCGTKLVYRYYIAKDIYGNTVNTKGISTQAITVNRPAVVLPTVADVTISCESTPAAVAATQTLACGVTFGFVSEMRVNLCGTTYKLVRTYQAVDACAGGVAGSMGMATVVQTITVKDVTTPSLTVTGTSYPLAASPSFTVCGGATVVPNKVRATTATSGVVGGVGTVAAPIAASTGAIAITALGDATMCGAGSVELKAVSADNCGDVTISVSDSRFTVSSAGVIKGNVMGNTSFSVISTDKCGNTSTVMVNVTVIDNVSPTAICDEVTATLNNRGQAVITGASFNHSSNDNCGIVRILVAKNVDGTVPTSTWCENITYTCADLGVAGLKVWIRYIDAAGNFTDCCVPVFIKDKATIACQSAADVSVPCNDARLINVGSLFTAPSVFYDGCSSTVPSVSNSNTASGCGSSTFTRTWSYTITNSLGSQSVSCSQTISTTAVRGFRVKRLADQDVTCAGAVSTLKEDQDAIIASMQLLHTGTNDPNFVIVPAAGYTTCSAPVVDTTESIYRNSVYCKVIVRTFVVKDLCDFSTVNSSITQGNTYNIVTSNAGLVIQSVTDAAGRHYMIFTRTIRIIDNTAPTSVPPVIAPFCATTACNFGFSTVLPGDDGCGTAAISNANLFFSWRLVNAAGATVSTGSTSAVSATGLAFGTYRVFYRVSDLCGNISTEYSFPISGKDCKAPEILVHNKFIELAGTIGVSASGMGTLNYADIRNRITDNCYGDLTNDSKVTLERGGVTTNAAPTAAIGTKSVMFTCADAGKVIEVRVWANDNPDNTALGNWNYVVTLITVQDNIGICRPSAAAAGLVGTENGSMVKDVVVSANVAGSVVGSYTSPAAGTFNVTGLTPGTNVQVRAAKSIDTDKKNGVTTLDIALISKHLLGETALNSPFKIIGADVDKSGEVDATDMLHIRRFILSITSNLPAGSAWRFVDKSYAFRDATNPLGEDFPEVVSLTNIPTGTSAANFTAVKLGDVNNSFDATQVRGSRVLAFNAADMNVVAGNEYTVAINADNFNAAAFQGTFAFEGATVKAVKAGNLNNVSDANFGMFSNAVSASWNGKSETSANVLNITFVATKTGLLSEMLTVNSAVTMAEGYDAAGNAMNVTLKFNTGKVAGGEFALYQNTPNPVALSTTIGFNLPKDGQAKLTIYTAEGKVLSVINNTYKAGVNQISINKSDLNASGMLYYRLDTQDNSSTRKMIIIE
jgi:hypothetical protein